MFLCLLKKLLKHKNTESFFSNANIQYYFNLILRRLGFDFWYDEKVALKAFLNSERAKDKHHYRYTHYTRALLGWKTFERNEKCWSDKIVLKEQKNISVGTLVWGDANEDSRYRLYTRRLWKYFINYLFGRKKVFSLCLRGMYWGMDFFGLMEWRKEN